MTANQISKATGQAAANLQTAGPSSKLIHPGRNFSFQQIDKVKYLFIHMALISDSLIRHQFSSSPVSQSKFSFVSQTSVRLILLGAQFQTDGNCLISQILKGLYIYSTIV